jgi:hypothetical protein
MERQKKNGGELIIFCKEFHAEALRYRELLREHCVSA